MILGNNFCFRLVFYVFFLIFFFFLVCLVYRLSLFRLIYDELFWTVLLDTFPVSDNFITEYKKNYNVKDWNTKKKEKVKTVHDFMKPYFSFKFIRIG